MDAKRLKAIYSALQSRAKGKPWAAPQFTRDDLSRWLIERSDHRNGVAFRCAYGAPGCSRGRFGLTLAEVELDHRTPVAHGGLTTLDNLAVSCASCNRKKGALDEPHFRALMGFLFTWPEHQSTRVWERLSQPPRAWQRAKGR